MRQIIPTFSLLWVGMVHDFWMYRSDPDFVRAQLSGTRSVLDWFLQRQRTDGLLMNIPWWPFLDWGTDSEYRRRMTMEDLLLSPCNLSSHCDIRRTWNRYC